jgi:hypothetical protein
MATADVTVRVAPSGALMDGSAMRNPRTGLVDAVRERVVLTGESGREVVIEPIYLKGLGWVLPTTDGRSEDVVALLERAIEIFEKMDARLAAMSGTLP